MGFWTYQSIIRLVHGCIGVMALAGVITYADGCEDILKLIDKRDQARIVHVDTVVHRQNSGAWVNIELPNSRVAPRRRRHGGRK